MKKIITHIAIVLLMALSVSFISSCKRGSDDPFISFRSRDGRLTGKWKLSKYLYVSKEIDQSDVTDYKIEFDGSKVTETEVDNGGTPQVMTDSRTHTVLLNLEKGGSIVYSENIQSGSSNSGMASKGHWYWEDHNKKKAGLMLDLDNTGDFLSSATYEIQRLSHKELVLVRKSYMNEHSGSFGNYEETVTETLTFVPE